MNLRCDTRYTPVFQKAREKISEKWISGFGPNKEPAEAITFLGLGESICIPGYTEVWEELADRKDQRQSSKSPQWCGNIILNFTNGLEVQAETREMAPILLSLVYHRALT